MAGKINLKKFERQIKIYLDIMSEWRIKLNHKLTQCQNRIKRIQRIEKLCQQAHQKGQMQEKKKS